MRHFNVCARAEFIDQRDGKRKHKWLLAGHMRVTDVGGHYLVLNHQPSVQFELFEQRIEPKPAEQTVDTTSDSPDADTH